MTEPHPLQLPIKRLWWCWGLTVGSLSAYLFSGFLVQGRGLNLQPWYLRQQSLLGQCSYLLHSVFSSDGLY